MKKINGTIWSENLHETRKPRVQAVHPEDIHRAMAQGLEETDVLLWWSHMAHDRVEDAIIERVQPQVLSGIGLIVLHSGHRSKIFKRLMDTFCSLKWREAGARERLWNLRPDYADYTFAGNPNHTRHVGNFLTTIQGERAVICTSQNELEAAWLALGTGWLIWLENFRPEELPQEEAA